MRLQESRAVIAETTKIKHPSSSELLIGQSTLKVNALSKTKDQGEYKCVVIDHSSNTASEQIKINILGK